MKIVASNSLTISNVNDGTITHTAYAYSADGTDRFSTVYPGENFIRNSDFRNGLDNWTGGTSSFIISQESGDNLVTVTVTGQNNIGVKASLYGTTMPVKTNDYIIVSGWFRGKDIEAGQFFIVEGYDSNGTRVQYNDIATNTAGLVWSTPVTNDTWSKFYLRWKITNANAVSAGFRFVPFHNGIYSYKKFKLEADTPDGKATPWMPSANEATTADWPSYIGQYSDFSSTASTDPAKYAPWTIFKGNDGVGITSTVITYANSTSGTTAPSTGWTSSIPSPVKGQYLWTKTVWTSTDTSSKTAYSVSYNSKDGTNGTDGTSGIIVSSVAPDSPQTGQLWQDTSTTPQLVKKWTGSSWVIWELYVENMNANNLSALSPNLGNITGGSYTSWFTEINARNGLKMLNGIYLFNGRIRSLVIQSENIIDQDTVLGSGVLTTAHGTEQYGGRIRYFAGAFNLGITPNQLLHDMETYGYWSEYDIAGTTGKSALASEIIGYSDGINISGNLVVNSIPMNATSSTTVTLFQGINTVFRRQGNLVTVTISRQVLDTNKIGEDILISEKIPSGFRPSYPHYFVINRNERTNMLKDLIMGIESNGDVRVTISESGLSVFAGSTSYFTEDPLPL